MATVQSIVEAGYAGSTANEAGDLAGDTELIGYLNRVFQAAFALAAAADPAKYSTRVTITCVASVATLPTDVIDVLIVRAGGVKVHLAEVQNLHRANEIPPVMFREGNTLVSRGLPGDPGPTQVLSVSCTAPPTALTTLAQSLDARWPERYNEMLVAAVRLYLAMKDEGRSPAHLSMTAQAYTAAVTQFLRLAGLQPTALETPHGRQLAQIDLSPAKP